MAFMEKELLLHSLSGKPNNGNRAEPVRPLFDPSKFAIFRTVLFKQFPDLNGDRRVLTSKIHAVI